MASFDKALYEEFFALALAVEEHRYLFIKIAFLASIKNDLDETLLSRQHWSFRPFRGCAAANGADVIYEQGLVAGVLEFEFYRGRNIQFHSSKIVGGWR